jgi:hypothetical protein
MGSAITPRRYRLSQVGLNLDALADRGLGWVQCTRPLQAVAGSKGARLVWSAPGHPESPLPCSALNSSSLGLPPLSSLGPQQNTLDTNAGKHQHIGTFPHANNQLNCCCPTPSAHESALCCAMADGISMWRSTSMDFLEGSPPLLNMHPRGAADAAKLHICSRRHTMSDGTYF